MSGVPLDPRVAERVSELGTAELVVGIPSFNNAPTIGHVVRAVAAGLTKHFPGRRAVIVNSDGGSRDGTAEVVAAADFGAPAGPPGLAPRRPRPQARDAVPRPAGQGQRAADDLRHRRAAGRPRLRGRGLRPAQHHPGVDRAAAWAPGRRPRLRLRRPPVPAPQVRRHDHELDRVPAHPLALRAGRAAADRRRVRLLRAAGLALPAPARCGRPTWPASGSTSG